MRMGYLFFNGPRGRLEFRGCRGSNSARRLQQTFHSLDTTLDRMKLVCSVVETEVSIAEGHGAIKFSIPLYFRSSHFRDGYLARCLPCSAMRALATVSVTSNLHV